MSERDRDAVASGMAITLPDGACKELTVEWARWEATRHVPTPQPERQAAVDAAAGVCGTCQVIDECRELAEVSRYTGFAAGLPYRNGRPGSRSTSGGRWR